MASPEGVGPELEKAAQPGAPSHLLGLKLGRAVARGGVLSEAHNSLH